MMSLNTHTHTQEMIAASMGEKSSVPVRIFLCSIITPKVLQEGLSVCAFGLGIPPWLLYGKGLDRGRKKEGEGQNRACAQNFLE